MNRIVVLGVLLGLLLSGYGFAQSDRSEEVRRLMVGLESASRVQRINSAKIISRSGLQDQALYLTIADLLKAGYTREYEKDHADEMSWMCKALAASGEPQYRELLDEIVAKSPSLKLKRYAKQSSELIDHYAQRSKILNATDAWDEELSAEENRFVSMLKSDDIGLRRDAAKVIVRNLENDEKVFTAAASALSDMSKDLHSHSNNQYVDTMSWLCKALAASGDSKYIEVLEQVHGNTQNLKLRSYALKALNTLK